MFIAYVVVYFRMLNVLIAVFHGIIKHLNDFEVNILFPKNTPKYDNRMHRKELYINNHWLTLPDNFSIAKLWVFRC